jgi:hypothetical protein
MVVGAQKAKRLAQLQKNVEFRCPVMNCCEPQT